MKKVFAILVAGIFSGLILFTVSASANSNFPACHGKNSVPCRPDPQPSHGQDCVSHGNPQHSRDDQNDDHCGPVVAPSPTPTPTENPQCSVSCSTPTPTPKSPKAPRIAKNTPLAVTGVDGPAIVLIAALGLAFLFAGVALCSKNRTSQR